jgi:hypothetical protein
MWRDAGTGANALWKGAAITQSISSVADQAWQPYPREVQ